MLSCFSRAQLFSTPRTITCQAPLSVGFSGQEYCSGLPFPSSGDLPDPGIEPVSPAWQTDSSPLSHWGVNVMNAELCVVAQSYPTLLDPMGCNLPGSSVHVILQTGILEWVSMPSSRRSLWPRDRTHISSSPATAGRFFTISTTWEAQTNLVACMLPKNQSWFKHLAKAWHCHPVVATCTCTRHNLMQFPRNRATTPGLASVTGAHYKDIHALWDLRCPSL